jgi:hypothetical protein
MKWDYFTAYCYVQETNKQHKNSHWALNIYDDQHHGLDEGLKILGNQGWELVAVQQTWRGTAEYYLLPSWYIFKKQLSE